MGFTVKVSSRKIVAGLGYFALGFLLAGVLSHSLTYGFGLAPGLFRWFNTDGEKNFPAMFSCLLLLLSSALLLLITGAKRSANQPLILHWGGLTVLFSLLAADEWLSFHEKIGGAIQAVLPTGSIFHFAWIIVGLALVATVGLAYSGFLARLPGRYRRLFLTAAAIYILGAIGMEMVGGYYAEHHQQWSRAIWLTLTTIEEGLEMFGILTFIYALLSYIREFVGELKVSVLPLPEIPHRSAEASSSHRHS